MIQAIRDLLQLLETGHWPVFLLYWVTVWVLMLPRSFFAGMFFFSRKRGWIQKYPAKKFKTTFLVTVFNEDEKAFEKCLRGVYESALKGTEAFYIIAIVDGWGTVPEDKCERLAKIASKYCDVVLRTNVRHKRANLRSLVRVARQEGLLYDIICFLDSDTIVQSPDTIELLLRPFSDKKIGGVTTAQYVEEPKTRAQRISAWLEHARIVSSMGAASLFRQVPCLPGRLYAVRTEIIEDKMDDLVNDTFSVAWMGPWQCFAGDDRFITNCVLQAGYGTVMVPDAVVTTLAPATMVQTFKQWLRWGRSSQAYTVRSLWLLKPRNWMAAFICWGDIVITVSTVYIIAIHWPYAMITGASGVAFVQASISALLGMFLTVVVRQAPYLVTHPMSVRSIPEFVFMTTIGQFIRFYALITPHKIGRWGTRSGADEALLRDYKVWKRAPQLLQKGVLRVVDTE